MSNLRVRRIVLWSHLALGLTAALIVAVIGVTGAILAFTNDYGRWTNAEFFSAHPSGDPIGFDAVVAKIEQVYAPSRVESINLLWDDDDAYYFMNDRGPLIANTIDGRILDPRAGKAFTSKLVINATQFHTKLNAGNTGRRIRDIATLEVLLLIPTGLYLWWPAKRFLVKWNAPWHRRLWDLHNTLGALVALPILFLALTGLLIALHLPEIFVSAPPNEDIATTPHSIEMSDKALHVAAPLDAAFATANDHFPDLKTYQILLPESPTAVITVNKSPEGWSTRNQRSTIYIDRYSGAVLQTQPAREFTPAFKLYDLGRRLHGGQKFALPVRGFFALSSLLLAVLALTGLTLGLRKLLPKPRQKSPPARTTGQPDTL